MVSAARGIAAREDDVMITRGSQMAIDLVARSLIEPATRSRWSRPVTIWPSMSFDGRRAIVPIGVDGDGLDVPELARQCERRASAWCI